MSKETISSKTSFDIRSMTLVSVMTAVCCILAPVSIPIGPVPVSLSVLAVLLTAYLLGPKLGTLSILLYILIGLAGLPVFSGYQGGPAKLFGPTGGYIIGYLPLVLISGWAVWHSPSRKWYLHLIGMAVGMLTCYALGTGWFLLLMHTSLSEALALCVYPFVAFDGVKILTACILGNTITRALRPILPMRTDL